MPRYIIDSETLCEDYLKGMSVPALSKKYNCTNEVVYQRLKKSNDNKVLEHMRQRTQYNTTIDKDSIITDYVENGLSIENIAKKYNVADNYIKNLLNKSIDNKKVFMKINGADKSKDDLFKAELENIWNLNLSGKIDSYNVLNRINSLYNVYKEFNMI